MILNKETKTLLNFLNIAVDTISEENVHPYLFYLSYFNSLHATVLVCSFFNLTNLVSSDSWSFAIFYILLKL